MQQCIRTFIIPYLYKAQHVSGDTLPIIRSQKLHWQPLVFHMWKVVGLVVVGRCQATRPTTFHVWKTRGCQCSFWLLMMGGVSPETCWALYKYGIIKILIHCCILLDFLYELYYDARIHEHQVHSVGVWCALLCARPYNLLKQLVAEFRLGCALQLWTLKVARQPQTANNLSCQCPF